MRHYDFPALRFNQFYRRPHFDSSKLCRLEQTADHGFEASDILHFPTLAASFKQYTNGDKLILTYLLVNVFLNFGLTGCLAGRIWWIGRVSERVLGNQTLRRKYNSAVALTLESGILYPITLIVSVAVTIHRPTTPTMYPFLVQVVGIAPTLIIVRTVLGISVEQTRETDSDGDDNSKTLDTYRGAFSSQNRNEKVGNRTPTSRRSNRSSFGNRFAIPLRRDTMTTISQVEIPESIIEESMFRIGTSPSRGAPGAQPENRGTGFRFPGYQSGHSTTTRGATSNPHENGIQMPMQIHSESRQSKPRRPPRTPRGARAQRSIDETTTEGEAGSQNPRLNVVVHTSVEKVSEYRPRFQLQSFS
ncbi:hypothetical protein GYMLUDRAFT_464025 [Collybiopsis luxurians FD-317 M1]|uniref:Unplaced genomic scaffold GYMLUscaffold_16, whole genome shotgun sequence n=1 Tax=Collybiopsis luxurians FD-317 M1 TaxID=944289 RepID=A0A0D0CUQ3_9AGAR|nr:hypothetical protein GYMLUDRAFT_464025 [Collybiopsis luxurians FD-317 M1]